MAAMQADTPPAQLLLDWARLTAAGAARAVPGEGLRERKKRMTRQLLSDTATGMFLERGFDEVRVTEVAAACDVSEKTVYNYFPTKESLLLDREEAMVEAVRGAASAAGTTPVRAMLDVLASDLQSMIEAFAGYEDGAAAMTLIRRFHELVETTPSLRAHQHASMDRFVTVCAEALAARVDLDPEDPEPQVAALALVGLWRIQFRALARYSDGRRTPAEVAELVGQQVHRAARLTDAGLRTFDGLAPAARTSSRRPPRRSRARRGAPGVSG